MPHGLITHFNNYRVAAGGGGTPPSILDAQIAIDDGGQSGDSLSITFNSAVTAGQYIILAVLSGPLSNFIQDPSGFTKLYGDNAEWCLYVKKAVGNEGATFTVSSVNEAGVLWGLKIGGVASTPLDTNAITASSLVSPSITTSFGYELLLSFIYARSNNSAPTAPAGWTRGAATGHVNSAGGGPISLTYASLTQTAAGATGTATWAAVTNPFEVITLGIRSV